jgi:hypothetical protein
LLSLHASFGAVLENMLTPADAVVEIKQRAEEGDPVAQTKVGDHYRQNFKHVEAKHWYEQAASKGNLEAIAALGDLYSSTGGFGTNQLRANPANAFALHRLAAAMGDENTHLKVGMAYREGKVVPRDLVLAYKHFKLSKNIFAEQYRKQIVLEMSREQIAHAEQLVMNFQPTTFERAFETLVFDTIRLEGIFSSSGARIALVNGKSVTQGAEISLTVAALPVVIKCESIEKNAVVFSYGPSQRTISIGPRAASAS